MTEVLVFSVKAQVYILDQDLQTWSPHTFSVVNVSFYTDSATARTRIIAMENTEPKVNSLLLPDMIFHRPSETFGQWLDPTSGDLYGLNFTAKSDAENFEKLFNDSVAKATHPSQPASDSGSRTSAPAAKQAGNDEAELRRELAELKKLLAEKDHEAQRKLAEANSKSQSHLIATIDSLSTQLRTLTLENENSKSQLNSLRGSASSGDVIESQLRSTLAEIERLKQSLRQSSAGLGDWQKQIATYQKENQDLKIKINKMIELQRGMAGLLN